MSFLFIASSCQSVVPLPPQFAYLRFLYWHEGVVVLRTLVITGISHNIISSDVVIAFLYNCSTVMKRISLSKSFKFWVKCHMYVLFAVENQQGSKETCLTFFLLFIMHNIMSDHVLFITVG